MFRLEPVVTIEAISAAAIQKYRVRPVSDLLGRDDGQRGRYNIMKHRNYLLLWRLITLGTRTNRS
jgi:hypothetical protein